MLARSAPLVFLAGALAACAANPAPVGWIRPAEAAQRLALGGWIAVRCGGKPEPCAAGELIAVENDRFRVLGEAGLVDVPKGSVETAVLAAYTSDRGGLSAWAALGTLSTLSHGGFLLFTAPLWIGTGIGVAAAESRAPLVRYPERPMEDFRPYARFPQGLPSDVDAAALGPPWRP